MIDNNKQCYIIGHDNLLIECSNILLERKFQILGIISSLDIVKEWCDKNKIKFYNSINQLKDQTLECDYIFSIINFEILPEWLLNKPKYFAINYHDSLLPRYAGVHATSWAIINNEQYHGITWHIMTGKIDSGDILKQVVIPVMQDETALSLNLKCFQSAIESFSELSKELFFETYTKVPQNLEHRTYFAYGRKPKNNGLIDWNESAEDIERLFRALQFGNYINRLSLLKLIIGKDIYIPTELKRSKKRSKGPPGTIAKINNKEIHVVTKTYDIVISGVKSQIGNIYTIDKLIAKHQLTRQLKLKSISSEIRDRFERTSTSLFKFENFWVKELAEFNSTSVPFLDDNIEKNPISKCKHISSFKLSKRMEKEYKKSYPDIKYETLFLALILIYLYRVNNKNLISINIGGFENTEEFFLDGLVSTYIPLNIELNDNMSFKQLLTLIDKKISTIKINKTFLNDISLRYPEIKNNQSSVGILLNDKLQDTKTRQLNHHINFTILNNSVSLYLSNESKNENLNIYVSNILAHLEILLKGIIQKPNEAISLLPLLTPKEIKTILIDWNKTEKKYPKNKTITQLFEEQVKKIPNNIAVLFEDQQITYHQLNQKANQLAYYLKEHEISQGDFVALSIDRSIDMIIGMLGILKVGAAYIPIDPEFPEEQINNILNDTTSRFILTDQQSISRWSESFIEFKNILLINSGLLNIPSPKHSIDIKNESEDPCYVMYTSGSSGKPKGVMISHRNVIKLVINVNFITINNLDVVAQISNFAFDASTFEIWGALLNGARLIILQTSILFDNKNIDEFLRNKVTVMWLTSSLFNHVYRQNPRLLYQVKNLLVGGEKLNINTIKEFILNRGKKSVQLINGYGPTECTTFTTTYQIGKEVFKFLSVPIGKPISNTKCYVLNKFYNPIPVGVIGELFIAGDGVSQGYVNNLDFTNQKFINLNIFSKNHLYRSGDLVRWLPDGNLEYIGRNDDQIKLRGFRIELGEIETVILSHPDILQTVICIRELDSYKKQLEAYYIKRVNNKNLQKELESLLKLKLPVYMLPTKYYEIDSFPLTRNGKIDKHALMLTFDNVNSIPIKNEKRVLTNNELFLKNILQDVLNIGDIDIYDNFFFLGVDSIIAMQIVTKANDKGLRISVKDIFQFPSIIKLAEKAKQYSTADHSEILVNQKFELSPIQKWFFEQDFYRKESFSQVCLLNMKLPVDVPLLKQCLEYILQTEESLNLRFEKINNNWKQYYSYNVKSDVVIHTINTSGSDKEQLHDCIHDWSIQLQKDFDLKNGPLVKAAIFSCEFANSIKLLILIHHLIIDAYSFRIILDKLAILYKHRFNKTILNSTSKNFSYYKWIEALSSFSNSSLNDQISLWSTQHKNTQLPLDHQLGPNIEKTNQSLTIEFDEIQTQQFIKDIPIHYGFKINEVLVSCLVIVLTRWLKCKGIMLDLESHGRAEITDDVDLSKTIGWFTSLYSFYFTYKEDSIGNIINLIKQQLNSIPEYGIGYGLLRFSNKQKIAAQSQIAFNYWGQFNQDLSESGFIFEELKLVSHPENQRTHLFVIDAMIKNHKLFITWNYSYNFHNNKTIEQLTDNLKSLLINLLAESALLIQKDNQTINYTYQNSLTKIKEIEISYPLSSLQKGLLFHSINTPTAGSYIVHLVWKSKISSFLNLNRLKHAAELLLERHAILRSFFQWENRDEPIQIVSTSYNIPWSEYDWTEVKEEDIQNRLNIFLKADREAGFDLSNAPLLRFTMIKLAEQQKLIILTIHHILLDGWSVPILINELNTLYQQQDTDGLPAITGTYKDFIHWQQKQDLIKAKQFWQNYLFDFSTSLQLPIIEDISSNSQTNQVINISYHQLELTNDLSSKISIFCRDNKITINIFFQAIWALLLRHYTSENDIVFGVTLTERNPEIYNSSSIIGLLVNTLPLRIQFKNDMTVIEYLLYVQKQFSEITEYHYTPIVEIQKWMNFSNGLPLFNSIFVFENYPTLHNSDCFFKFEEFEIIDPTHYPLTCIIIPNKEIKIKFAYDKERISDESIVCLRNHLFNLLIEVISVSKQQIQYLNILSSNELQKVIIDFNRTKIKYPKDKTLNQLFEEQVERSPQHIALVFENKSLTYEDLNNLSNQLAHHLHTKSVQIEDIIPIYLERSIDMVISMLAIMKAGGICVPMDPNIPIERNHYILNDTKPRLIITQQSVYNNNQDLFKNTNLQIIFIDKACTFIDYPNTNLNLLIRPVHPLYVIYTSGSTGKPKGVVVKNQSVVNLLHAINLHLKITTSDRLLAVTTITFDISILELFLPLIVGATCVTAQYHTIIDGKALKSVIKQQHISILQATPYTWRMLIEAGWINNRPFKIICGGEALSPELAAQLLKRSTDVWNVYGPTETTIWSTIHKITTNDLNKRYIPLGKPLGNTQIYILDASLNPISIGVIGEIYISGDGLAQGYLNQFKLTEQKFIYHNFSGMKKQRLYKTGDLGRWLDDGSIEFIARNDDQIKLNGFRIELGEVEHFLNSYPSIKQSVVVSQSNKHKDNQLVAFVIPKQGIKPKRIDFSLFYFSANSDSDNIYDLYISSAKYADQAGFKAVWTPERHFHPMGGPYPNPSVLNAALATITKTIQLRAGSVVLPLHHPLRVVEEWSVVDNLSNGRVGIAFASGWNPKDFALAPDNYAHRKQVMFQAIEEVKTLWNGENVSFEDGLENKNNIRVFPKPKQKELPIWITAAYDSETFIKAGKMGANILTHLIGQSIEDLSKKITLYHQTLKNFGYQPEDKTVTLMLHTFIWEDKAKAIEICEKPFCDYLKSHVSLLTMAQTIGKESKSYSEAEINEIIKIAFKKYVETASLIGDVNSCLNLIQKLVETGIDEIACLIDFGVDNQLVLQSLEKLNELRLLSQDIPQIDPIDLSNYLKEHLPSYMIPKTIIPLSQLPITPNGKIDKKKLVKQLIQKNEIFNRKLLSPPLTLTEKKLAQIWSEILLVTTIDRHDNFFELGGHSLLALQTLAKINSEWHINFSVRILFEAPTLYEFASKIDQEQDCKSVEVSYEDKENCLITLQSGENKMPLFLIHPVGGTIFWYSLLPKYVDNDRPILAFQDPGIGNKEIPFQTVLEMVNYYVSLIKSKQPTGPYLLGGASSGGNLCVEVAKQLQKNGDKVIFIGLFDAWVPYPDLLLKQEFFEANMRRQYNAMHEKFYSKGIMQAEALLNLQWHRLNMYKQHVISSTDLKLTLFKAAQTIPIYQTIEDKYNHWEHYCTSSIERYVIPGDHESIFQEPNIAILGKKLNECLNQTET